MKTIAGEDLVEKACSEKKTWDRLTIFIEGLKGKILVDRAELLRNHCSGKPCHGGKVIREILKE